MRHHADGPFSGKGWDFLVCPLRRTGSTIAAVRETIRMPACCRWCRSARIVILHKAAAGCEVSSAMCAAASGATGRIGERRVLDADSIMPQGWRPRPAGPPEYDYIIPPCRRESPSSARRSSSRTECDPQLDLPRSACFLPYRDHRRDGARGPCPDRRHEARSCAASQWRGRPGGTRHAARFVRSGGPRPAAATLCCHRIRRQRHTNFRAALTPVF